MTDPTGSAIRALAAENDALKRRVEVMREALTRIYRHCLWPEEVARAALK